MQIRRQKQSDSNTKAKIQNDIHGKIGRELKQVARGMRTLSLDKLFEVENGEEKGEIF